MEAFPVLRRFAYDLRKKLFQKRQLIPQPFQHGLPQGITPDTLNTVCKEYFDEKPLSFSNQHLSAWKPSGAYRLLIKTQRGNEISLIYKNAIYVNDQIPALIDLPIRPGPPEYSIYSQPVGSLAPFLPRVYIAEEITPGVQYHYLLEDLGPEYHKVFRSEDIPYVSSQLPRLHQALAEWSAELRPHCLLAYGKEFSRSLQGYARLNLERCSQYTNDPELKSTLKSILEDWTQISEIHLLPEFFNLQQSRLIHGDANYTNIHIHNQHPHQFKMVDWEWAGYGLPHADLASLVKAMPSHIQHSAVKKFLGSAQNVNPALNPQLTPQENYRLYLWCLLERGLLDAAFLTVQHLQALYLAKFNLQEAVDLSLKQVLTVSRQLAS